MPSAACANPSCLQTLKTGIVAVRCYWLKSPRPLPFLQSISSSSPIPSAVDSAHGANIRPIASVLTQLCVGSIQSNTVSPADALLALEGMLALGELHGIFLVAWFQADCWQALFTPCLRVLLLRSLNMHATAVESLFIALCDARCAFLRLEGQEDSSRRIREFWGYVAQEVSPLCLLLRCNRC